ncbi:MAG: hypothetical protein P8Y69_14815, partial [Gammaproteobacteria bacterium]
EAAVEVAQRMGPGHRIFPGLCDTGHKYQSRLFNDECLAEKGLARPRRRTTVSARRLGGA